MSLLIDVILIIVIICSIYSGIKRGFINSVMRFVTFIAAFISANKFTPYLSVYYKDNIFMEKFTKSVSDGINSLINQGIDSIDISALFNDKPDAFLSILSKFNIDYSSVEGFYQSKLAEGAKNLTDSISNFIAEPFAISISDALAYITIFFGTVIILKLVTFLLDIIFKFPILNFANRTLGIVFGLICGILYVWLLTWLLVSMLPILNSLNPTMFPADVFEKSFVFKWFYDNNLLKNIFVKDIL